MSTVLSLVGFSGGLNTKKAPVYLNNNESTVCNNCDLTSGAIKPIKGPLHLEMDQPPYVYVATLKEGSTYTDTRIFSANYRDYIVWNGSAYYTEDDATFTTIKRLSLVAGNITEFEAYLSPISTAVSVSLVTTPYCLTPAYNNLTMEYAVTLYNSTTGSESPPVYSSITFPADATSTSEVLKLSGLPTSSTVADKLRVYRRGAGIAAFRLTNEMDIGSSTYQEYILSNYKSDNTYGTNFKPDSVLTSLLTTESIETPPTGMSNLIELGAIFYASKDNKVYFNTTGVPGNFSLSNYISVPSKVIGLAKSQLGLLIFTKNDNTYILAGASVADFSLRLFSANISCKNKKTIAYQDNVTMWLDDTGLIVSSGAGTKNLSFSKYPELASVDIISSVIFNNMYLASDSTGKIHAFDGRLDTPIFWTASTGDFSSMVKEGDKLLACSRSGRLSYLFETGVESFEYVTRTFLGGTGTSTFELLTIIFAFKGVVTVELYSGSALLGSKTTDSSTEYKVNYFKIDQTVNRKDSFYLRFTGSGEIVTVDIQYNLLNP